MQLITLMLNKINLIYPFKMITRKANPNATNSELDAKIIIQNDKQKDEDKEQYDKIPKRY